MSQRRGCNGAAPAPSNDDSEDVKAGSVTDRRILRSHYRRLKASIAERKEGFSNGDINYFDEIVRRADDLYTLVHRPREQIADAEALLDITEAFLNSVKDSRRGNAVKAGDFISVILQNFRQPTNLDDSEIIILDWAAIGSEANCIFHDAPGLHTMLGPMDSEPKKRKVTAPRRRERVPASETARPETVGDEEGEQQSQTDKNIRTMFNALRRLGGGCDLEQLVLSRDSFSETVENIFCLSFLVKDGRAQISIEDGKQVVAIRNAPTAAERYGRAQGGETHQQIVNTQFVFRFDFKDWILMKEIVEPGKELMPRRSELAPASQNPSTPIRKNSRNRGRITSSEPSELQIQLHSDEGDSEGQDEEENNLSAESRRPMKKRIF